MGTLMQTERMRKMPIEMPTMKSRQRLMQMMRKRQRWKLRTK